MNHIHENINATANDPIGIYSNIENDDINFCDQPNFNANGWITKRKKSRYIKNVNNESWDFE